MVEVVQSMMCRSLHHKVIPFRGIIPVLASDNKQINYEVYVEYCTECGKYSMFHSDYIELLNVGKPLCVVYKQNDVSKEVKKSPFKYKSQSVLNALGYSVSMELNFDKDKRQELLTKAIESQTFDVADLISFLNWLIQTRATQSKYKEAVRKWEEDLFFVKNYKKEDRNIMNVNAIEIR